MLQEGLSMATTLAVLLCYQQGMVRRGRTVTASHRRWTAAMLIHLCLVLFLTGGGVSRALSGMGLSVGMVGGIRLGLLVLFMAPLGFFVPHIWCNFQAMEEVGFVGYLFVLLTELVQLPVFGSMAPLDVCVGTLGTLMGFLYWRGIGHYRHYGRGSERTMALCRSEPLIYVGMAVSCHVLCGAMPLFL